MELDWARLARELAAARKRTGMTQREVAAALGDLGLATIQAMERESHRYTRISQNHRAAARLYGWADGSIERVLEGQEPLPAPQTAGDAQTPAPPTPTATAPSGLPDGTPQRVRRALSGGEAIDTELIPLDPDDPDSSLVMMIKQGDKELTDAKLDWAMRRWVKLTEIAREIYRQDPPPKD